MTVPNLQFSSESLGHLLADRWLEVPSYQRGYAWVEEHVAEYWSDITDSRDEARQYFLGAVVLTHSGGRHQVIDGQQRLATTTLLFAAIRDELAEQGEDELAAHVNTRYLTAYNAEARTMEPRFNVLASDRDFYVQRFILRSGGEPASASQRRLTAAFNFLRSSVAKLGYDSSGLMDLVNHLEKSVLIVLVEAASDADAFQIFETLNDRGAPLTIADLLKNYLMSLSGGDSEAVASAWEYATSNLGADAETDDFVTYIRHYWSSLRGATRERDLYRSLRRNITESHDALELAGNLATASDYYAAITDATHPLWIEYPPLAAQSVKTLLFLQLGQYRPLLLAAMQEFDPEEFSKLAEALVCWNVRGLVSGGIGGGTTERAYASAGVNVRSGKLKSTEAVFDQLRPIISSDEEFRKSFESASAPRARIAQYLLRGLNRALVKGETPSIEVEDDRVPTVAPMLHRQIVADEWTSFAPEEVPRLINRLGNLFLRESTRTPLPGDFDGRRDALVHDVFPVNDFLKSVDYWSPVHIRHRQQDLSAVAVQAWPRMGSTQ